jgi:competence protein ComGC
MKNCNEIKQMLSAYADGEISEEDKKAVDLHIQTCPGCKEALNEQIELLAKLKNMVNTPPLPGENGAIMSAITGKTARKPRLWLRPVLVAAPFVLALAIILPIVIPNLALTPEKVLAKASAAILKVQSYRFTENLYTLDPVTKEFSVPDYHSDAEVTSNSYRIQWRPGSAEKYLTQAIVFDTKEYILGGGSSNYLTPEQMQEISPSARITQGMLDMLEKIEVLSEETIEGAACFHYRGTVDIEKYLEQQKPALEKIYERDFGTYSEEEFRKIYDPLVEEFRTKKVTDEFWIGKDDYIIRQWKEVILPTNIADDSSSDMIRSTSDLRTYYDFNAPIEIKAPLDAQGNLLPGWSLATPDSSGLTGK